MHRIYRLAIVPLLKYLLSSDGQSHLAGTISLDEQPSALKNVPTKSSKLARQDHKSSLILPILILPNLLCHSSIHPKIQSCERKSLVESDVNVKVFSLLSNQ